MRQYGSSLRSMANPAYGRRVLLVTPDNEIRRGFAAVGALWGWDVCFGDVDDYPALAPGDLIVLDVCPEGVPRIGAIAEARAMAPHADIVAVTAYPSVSLAVSVMRAGASNCLSLPITEASFVEPGVEGWTRRKEREDELPSLGRMEWDYIARVLQLTEGNISRTAKILGIQRSTLQRKLKKYPPRR